MAPPAKRARSSETGTSSSPSGKENTATTSKKGPGRARKSPLAAAKGKGPAAPTSGPVTPAKSNSAGTKPVSTPEVLRTPGGSVVSGTPDESSTIYKLTHMVLKRTIKEPHGEAIHNISFASPAGEQNAHVAATVGGTTSHIYDNSHCGSHLDVFMAFPNVDVPGLVKGGPLTWSAWVSAPGLPQDPEQLFLATGGPADPTIQVISIRHKKVVQLLKGHTDIIIDVATSVHAPGLLATVSKDSTVRVWEASKGRLLLVYDFQASRAAGGTSIEGPHSICWVKDPTFAQGPYLLVGTSKGELVPISVPQWAFPELGPNGSPSKPVKPSGNVPPPITYTPPSFAPITVAAVRGAPIDCIRAFPPTASRDQSPLIAVHSADGLIILVTLSGHPAHTQAANLKLLSHESIKVPHGALGPTLRSRFDISPDGTALVAGNNHGTIYVYDTSARGKIALLTNYEHRKSRFDVRSVAISHDSNHILYVGAGAYIWRYDFVDPQPTPVAQK